MKIIDLEEVDGTFVPVDEGREEPEQPRPRPVKAKAGRPNKKVHPVPRPAPQARQKPRPKQAVDDFFEGMDVVSRFFGGMR